MINSQTSHLISHMDSFDDLLVPSRHILEENPFADPFAKRSNSPDPWASPFSTSQSSSETFGSTTTATGQSESLYQDTRYGSSSRETSTEEHATSVVKDPLDSESLAHSEEDDSPNVGPYRLPGFKQSIEQESQFSETATIRPNDSENFIESTFAGDAEPVVSHTAERASSPQTSHFPADSMPSSPGPAEESFTSLLQSDHAGIDHSIANLSLGAEPTTGWMNEQMAWGGESSLLVAPQPPVDDDSDDDKPIRQTLKTNIQQDASVRFRVFGICAADKTIAIRNQSQIQALFVISVEDPQKVGDHIRPYIMYTVHTQVRMLHITYKTSNQLFSRQPHPCSKGPRFQSFDAIRIFFGYTRRSA